MSKKKYQFICYIMFFSIENPDVKMLETTELAKEQAERANRSKSDFLSSMYSKQNNNTTHKY